MEYDIENILKEMDIEFSIFWKEFDELILNVNELEKNINELFISAFDSKIGGKNERKKMPKM